MIGAAKLPALWIAILLTPLHWRSQNNYNQISTLSHLIFKLDNTPLQPDTVS